MNSEARNGLEYPLCREFFSGIFAVVLVLVALLASCDAGDPAGYAPPPIEATDAHTTEGQDATIEPSGPCLTSFRYRPPPGRIVSNVAIRGQWQNLAAPGIALKGPDANGEFALDVEVSSGLQAYKLLIDGSPELDPAQALRKYVGGIEHSAVRVRDCKIPLLTLSSMSVTRGSDGLGHVQAFVHYDLHGGALDPASVVATLKRDGDPVGTATVHLDNNKREIALEAGALADGKYTLVTSAKNSSGTAARPLRVVFWIESEAFGWKDALIYMVMTDRFVDGDASNNVVPPNGVDSRTVYKGGDLQGLRSVIQSGYFDQLGVRALWISPFNTNPTGPFLADDGVHQATGYHGYWPVRAREVDARIGGAAALKALVKEAHAHGIRVLMDFVINHVHAEHEYFTAHPDWFRTGCVCGTTNCDWTAKRLECLFSDYLPDVNWTVTEASEQYGDDAVWWMDTFDLDGFRFDAVKHVEDLAIRNLSARIRSEFEASGTRVFLTGETAMGWSDCGLSCNQNEYGTISRYVGPFGLDGQIDFVLYHAVPYRVFAYDQKGLIHADYWANASGTQYPTGAIMTPYIGSHDTPRFATLASYRGQDASHGVGVPGNKWTGAAGPPPDAESYARHRLALGWVLGLPGAPLLYYGDEYGEWGGADPNNRPMWRGQGTLSAAESGTLSLSRMLGQARKLLPALRRGEYRSVYSTENQLVFARQTSAGEIALVALNRSASPATFTAALPLTLPLKSGTTLKDQLGGPDVTVIAGGVTLTLPARGTAVLGP